MAFVQTVRRIQLGSELHRIREELGHSAEDVYKALPTWSVYKISRVENAKGACKVDEVRKLLDFYQAEDDLKAGLLDIAKNAGKQGWWISYTGAVGEGTVNLAALESEASAIKTYEASFIPGLMQTPDYARAVFTELGGLPPDAAEAKVEVRIARQSVLTRPGAPEVWAVIHEAALNVNAGSPDIMRAQLERLIQLSRLPNVNIQIMPAGCAFNPAMNGAFTILGFPYRPALDVVLVPAQATELWVEKRALVATYHAAFQKITAAGLPLDRSHAFITEQRDKIK
ncbi:helix-turn-helix domain-containing protein [Kitasatospora sp. NPDC059817]|uniref:helix-turn-helix domain-containing protein n=1 Tax=Kitasatospora sp. NPDC059817 TaxID=3346961 RepID=UPI00365FF0D4